MTSGFRKLTLEFSIFRAVVIFFIPTSGVIIHRINRGGVKLWKTSPQETTGSLCMIHLVVENSAVRYNRSIFGYRVTP